MKLAVQFGLITGIASCFWEHMEYVYDINHESFGGAAGFILYFILFAGIGIGIYYRRGSEEFGIGNLSFKEGARTGVIISLVAGVCLAAYAMLHGLVINPEYLQEYTSFVREALEKKGEPEAKILQEIAQIEKDGSVGALMFAKFTVTLVIGMVGTFIIAALMKREPKGT